MTLEGRRRHERRKYVSLLRRKPHYGTTNHGRDAVCLLKRYGAESVIDVGCGDNSLVQDLRDRYGIRAVGVDFADNRADCLASAHELPFSDGSFEWLTAFDVMEHLLTEEIDSVLAEFHRVASTGWIFSICYRDSKIRSDGETLHPTVRPENWWINRLSEWIEIRKDRGYLYGMLL